MSDAPDAPVARETDGLGSEPLSEDWNWARASYEATCGLPEGDGLPTMRALRAAVGGDLASLAERLDAVAGWQEGILARLAVLEDGLSRGLTSGGAFRLHVEQGLSDTDAVARQCARAIKDVRIAISDLDGKLSPALERLLEAEDDADLHGNRLVNHEIRLAAIEVEMHDFCVLADRLEALVVLAEKQAEAAPEPPQSPAERGTGAGLLGVPAGLDAGIAPMVAVLMAAGVETFESCEGGPGHAYPEPTVRFHGQSMEGFRALAVALAAGLRVADVRRTWDVIDGEPVGPHWEMTFVVPAERRTGEDAATCPRCFVTVAGEDVVLCTLDGCPLRWKATKPVAPAAPALPVEAEREELAALVDEEADHYEDIARSDEEDAHAEKLRRAAALLRTLPPEDEGWMLTTVIADVLGGYNFEEMGPWETVSVEALRHDLVRAVYEWSRQGDHWRIEVDASAAHDVLTAAGAPDGSLFERVTWLQGRVPTEAVPGVYSLRHLREAWLDGWESAGGDIHRLESVRENAWCDFTRRAGVGGVAAPVGTAAKPFVWLTELGARGIEHQHIGVDYVQAYAKPVTDPQVPMVPLYREPPRAAGGMLTREEASTLTSNYATQVRIANNFGDNYQSLETAHTALLSALTRPAPGGTAWTEEERKALRWAVYEEVGADHDGDPAPDLRVLAGIADRLERGEAP